MTIRERLAKLNLFASHLLDALAEEGYPARQATVTKWCTGKTPAPPHAMKIVEDWETGKRKIPYRLDRKK